MPNNIKGYLLELLENQEDKIRDQLEDDLFKDELNLIANSMDYLNNISNDKKLILEALEAYKDTDNDDYNIEINDLINKIKTN